MRLCRETGKCASDQAKHSDALPPAIAVRRTGCRRTCSTSKSKERARLEMACNWRLQQKSSWIIRLGACRTWGIVTRKKEIENRFSQIWERIAGLFVENLWKYGPIFLFCNRFIPSPMGSFCSNSLPAFFSKRPLRYSCATMGQPSWESKMKINNDKPMKAFSNSLQSSTYASDKSAYINLDQRLKNVKGGKI